MFKINEIFHSIQGEGFYTGSNAVFVRFAGCNLSCWFCDTDFSDYKVYTAKQLVTEVLALARRGGRKPIIVLTGGEPLLQIKDHPGLLKEFQIRGFPVHIETNATIDFPYGVADWVTASPKPGSTTKIKQVNEVKFLVNRYGIIQADNPFEIKSDYFYLQPCLIGDKVEDGLAIRKAFDLVRGISAGNELEEIKEWRLSCQIHKYLNLR